MKNTLKWGLALLVLLFVLVEGIAYFSWRKAQLNISHMDEIMYPLLSASKTLSAKVAESQMQLSRFRLDRTGDIDNLINDVEELDDSAKTLLSSGEFANVQTEFEELSALIEQYQLLVSQVITTKDPKAVLPLSEAAFQCGLKIQNLATKAEAFIQC